MKFDYLIIGSGIAGVSAAETLRKNNKDCSICLISNEPHDPYSKVLLPFWLKGKVKHNQLFIRGNNFWQKNNINFIVGEAKELSREEKKIILADGQEFLYKKLLIASGANAKKLNFSGIDLGGIFYFRNLDEAAKIKDYLQKIKNDGIAPLPVIYGASFIALEFAGLFAHFGIPAKIIFRGPYFWSRVLDEQGSRLIEKFLGEAGMELRAEEEILRVEEASGKTLELYEVVTTKDVYKCNFLGLGTGLKPNLDFIRGAELKVNQGIITDEYLSTSDQDIFAAGDIAEFYDTIIERNHVLGNWLNSDMQGRCAAANMLGKKQKFELVSFYSFTFDGYNGKGKFNICMIGDTNPKEPFKTEIKTEDNQYVQIFNKNNKCIGAVIINIPNLRSKIIENIKAGLGLHQLDI